MDFVRISEWTCYITMRNEKEGRSDREKERQRDGARLCPSIPLSLCPSVSPSSRSAAPSKFVLAAGADFVEEPDAFLGVIQDLLQHIAGRRVAVFIGYFDCGALLFG